MKWRHALLVVCVSALWSARPPHAQNKTACELIPLADISAVFGREMFLRPTRPQPPENCSFSSTAPFDRPTGPQVNLQVRWSHDAMPDADAMVDAARVLLQQRQVQTTSVPGIGDAAFWFGNDVTGELWVFRGGVDTLVLSGQLPLEKFKALASKALGGSGRTGFAYAGPNTEKPSPSALAAAEPPLVGGASFSQAIYITPGEFLKQVKEVSLSVDDSPELSKQMSAAEQRNYVTRALAAHGISVRAGAPVALLATFDEHDSVGTSTQYSSRNGTSSEQFHIHNVYVSLDFYVRAVVMRNGQAHLVTVAAARESQEDQYVEDNDLRKLLFGDETRGDMKDLVAWLIDDSLDRIASNHAIDPAPWYANGWTAAQKTAADAEFLRLMNSGQRSEQLTTAGIDTIPQLELVQPATDAVDEGCPAPASWRTSWSAAFQHNRWTKPQTPAPLTLRHSFYCRHIPVFRFSPGYYRLVDDIALRESNAVFVLNGRVFRKPGTLLSAHHFTTPSYSSSGGGTLDDALVAAEQTFIPQSVAEYSTRLGLVDVSVPVIPATPVRIVTATASPDNPVARAKVFRPDAWERKWDVPFYRVGDYRPELARKGRLILQGTVARISMEGNYPRSLHIYFKEAPDNVVTACTPSPDIFDQFGDGYKGLIGRTIEVVGDVEGLCTPKGGVRIYQSNQFRVLSTETAVP
jgi:hypothetical protein